MKRISKNRFVDALLKLMLLSAIIHIIILITFSIIKMDFTFINYFKILTIDLIVPSITQGVLSNVLSVAVVVILYILIFFFYTKK
jgi:hypothetical protein